jgi:hypothetical protein
MTSNEDEQGIPGALLLSISDRGGVFSACRRDRWQWTIPPRQSHIRVRIGNGVPERRLTSNICIENT